MECEKLLALAERFLNEKGQADIESHLDAGGLRTARVYLLGALDKKLEEGTMSSEELATAYKDLGLDPAEIADIRNRLPRR